jgi:hypothetical protein
MSEANPKGYNFQVRVTHGHEAEAKAAEMAKKPNRLGIFIVKLLGGKGKQDSHSPKNPNTGSGSRYLSTLAERELPHSRHLGGSRT